jgi:hypothetical protein
VNNEDHKKFQQKSVKIKSILCLPLILTNNSFVIQVNIRMMKGVVVSLIVICIKAVLVGATELTNWNSAAAINLKEPRLSQKFYLNPQLSVFLIADFVVFHTSSMSL